MPPLEAFVFFSGFMKCTSCALKIEGMRVAPPLLGTPVKKEKKSRGGDAPRKNLYWSYVTLSCRYVGMWLGYEWSIPLVFCLAVYQNCNSDSWGGATYGFLGLFFFSLELTISAWIQKGAPVCSWRKCGVYLTFLSNTSFFMRNFIWERRLPPNFWQILVLKLSHDFPHF